MRNAHFQIQKLLIGLFAAFLLACGASYAQIDTDLSDQTLALYANLKKLQNTKQFMFGQEFFNSFKYSSGSAHGEEDYSDSKAVTGAHPAVLGSDFHYYIDKSATERAYHTEAVRWAYQQGYVITFDWHMKGRGTSTHEYTETTKGLVNSILTNVNDDRAWFLGELDKVIDIINNDLVVNGERIPIIFRPFHEMNGAWFWWGSQSTNATNYRAFYQLVVDYVRARTHSVLFCWSPNTPVNFDYYPGDDYVDILGVDAYEVNADNLRPQLAAIVDYAQEKKKVAVLSETGNRTNNGNSPGDEASLYWKDQVLPAIVDDPSGKSQKIAWVLTWINSSWSFPYVPHVHSSALAKQSFIDFKNSDQVIFGDELPDMYTLAPLSAKSLKDCTQDLQVHINAETRALQIGLIDFEKKSTISIHNIDGKLIYKANIKGKQLSIPPSEIALSGTYLITVTDQKRSVTKKILAN